MRAEGEARRLAAILVADAVGYSALMMRDEQATLDAYKLDLSEKFEPWIGRYRGRIVKKTGDGVLAIFDSVLSAVQCAEKIQGDGGSTDTSASVHQGLTYRIGINLGDIIVDDDDVYGNDVNIAARLESLAQPGGIALSGQAYWSVKSAFKGRFEELGFLSLKNISDPIQVFRLKREGEPSQVSALGVPSSTPRSVSPGALPQIWADDREHRPVIIVLPFENQTPDGEHEYFCDGVTTDLTLDLARFASLVVISSNTAFSFKGQRPPPDRIYSLLGASYMVQGNIQRSGSRIRINAQLIDTKTGYHLCTERLDSDISDLFEIQDEVARKITSCLASRVGMLEVERAVRKDPRDVSSYDMFLKGLYCVARFLGSSSRSLLEEASSWFNAALERDPSYARPWGWQAYVKVLSWQHGWISGDCLKEAELMARRATQLDPADHDTHWALGSVLFNSGRFAEAHKQYQAALNLNGNDADLHAEMGEMLSCMGRHHDAIAQVRYAMRLNPNFREWYRWVLGWSFYFIREYEEALDELSRIIDPADEVLLIRAACHAHQSAIAKRDGARARAAESQKDARRLIEEFLERRPGWTTEKQLLVTRLALPDDVEHWSRGLTLAGLPVGRSSKRQSIGKGQSKGRRAL
ncbi:TolB-like protein/class 3 adenylate cyclase/Tfp pilus assembly protein PilF [Rhodoligotrophos appendicifer]|uniref:adenylate/guanylate cyclase domain-containing protein n=1 Tax=Rhodoligotrophos appendicifer TaxID=987056 RepID=UPI0011869900|nr:tetratricopeptide repeat protein [Rhodoligotrophos appendicifer]